MTQNPSEIVLASTKPRRLQLVGVEAFWGDVEIHLQPIVEIATGTAVAVEALARFPTAAASSPEQVFAAASAAEMTPDLEAACLRAALAARDRLPARTLLSVNVSPNVLGHPLIMQSWPADLDGVIVEVTEHQASDPSHLSDQLALLRRRGAAIAIDDVSTGYAGLLRLGTLRPDYVKVDRQVIAGVRDSIAQTAVLEALVTLSHRLGAKVIGEGVERIADLSALAEFDVDFVQGFAISPPAVQPEPIGTLIVETCLAGRRSLLRQPASAGHTAAQTRDMHGITAALARAAEHSDVHDAIVCAAAHLDVDVVGVSILDDEYHLREIAISGDQLDLHNYALSDYPATRTALATGVTVEAHLNDPGSDPAEQAVLARLGHASLLLVPLRVNERSIGILELAHRTPRRWTSQDIAETRGLAEHLCNALVHINVGPSRARTDRSGTGA